MSTSRAVAHATALSLSLGLMASGLGCTSGEPPTPLTEDVAAPALITADGVAGPLCPVLPAGDDPGNPTFLQDLDMAEALTWVPVLTTTEALVRASGLDEALASATDVTLLAPSDDTFVATMTQHTVDALIIDRTDEAATLLQAHVIDGALSLADLVAAGEVTTRAGVTLRITGTPTAPLIAADGEDGQSADEVEVLCGDYRTASGRLHVIGGVLGPLPPPQPGDPVDLQDDTA